MARPLFSLDARLDLCARLVRPGKNLCDVGADHGYLSIWLLRTGKTPRALATDLRAGPLAAAAKNAARYGVEDRLALRLTDGLDGVSPEDAEDFVLAGMGGETILEIIARAPWLRDDRYRLVLQPMSSADSLRVGLRQLGFALLEEQAVLDSGRPYTAFSAGFAGKLPEPDALYPYLGRLAPAGDAARLYAEKTLRDLYGRLQGAERGRGPQSPEELRTAIRAIEEDFLGKLS